MEEVKTAGACDGLEIEPPKIKQFCHKSKTSCENKSVSQSAALNRTSRLQVWEPPTDKSIATKLAKINRRNVSQNHVLYNTEAR